MKKILSLFVIMLLCVAITPIPAYAATTSYDLSSTKKIAIAENKTVKLTLPAKYKNVTWKSSNTKVASISKKGNLTTKTPGIATIAATSGKKKFTCTVYVNEDYSEWVLYSTSNLILLAENIIDGYVVYMNGRYYCSPEYFKRIEDAQIAYEHTIAGDDEITSSRDIVLTPEAKFTFAEDDKEEKAAEEAALKARIALMMKYGFSSSADADTEIGKAYMKFCEEWVSEYELESSYDTSVVQSIMDDKLYLITNVDNRYIINGAPQKPVSGTIYTNGEVQYQYLEKYEYNGENYTENQYYFYRQNLIEKGIIK